MIGVHQIDGKLPNLALLQVAQYFINRGHLVGHYMEGLDYTKVFASKIFKFSKMPEYPADLNVQMGGTGIDYFNRLPQAIENTRIGLESWNVLHPNFEPNMGFSMKGCRFKCEFCVVPKKEGRPIPYRSISELMIKDTKKLILLDNDFFGGPHWKDHMLEMIDRKIRVSFVQGLNIRILKPEQADLLAKVRFKNGSFSRSQVTFAWDRWKDKKLIERGIDMCMDAGIKGWQMQFFVLIGFDTSFEEDMERVMYLRSRNCDPFVMRMMEDEFYPTLFDKKRAIHFQRWVNSRQVFKTCTFEEYCKTKEFDLDLL